MTLVAGVDLGGTKIQTVVLRGSRVAGSARVLTPQTGAPDVVSAIAGTVNQAVAETGDGLSGLTAVGVGTPGSVDAEQGSVSRASNIAGFEKTFALGPEVSKALGGLRVAVGNDVNVAMLGEHRAGAGRAFRNVLGVFVGTGVGGGLVLGGKLHHGRGSAGEIGHMVVKSGGRLCGCGRKGCLEAYAGRGSMERTARQLAKKGHKTILFDVMEKREKTRFTSGVIAVAVERGDKMATQLVDEAVWALSIALASTQNLLDLEAIIIGGGLGDRLGKPFIERVAAAMTPHLFVIDRPPEMLGTELGDLSGAVGAALLAKS